MNKEQLILAYANGLTPADTADALVASIGDPNKAIELVADVGNQLDPNNPMYDFTISVSIQIQWKHPELLFNYI